MRTISSPTSQGRFQLPRHDPALGSSGRSVMDTPRPRETGRPRAAQFAPRAVYTPGGSATSCGRKARRLMTAHRLSRAQAGDGEAFRELTEPHRRELQVHCYRMLGSFQDAEDALQDTLLTAWQGLGGFEGRASLRTWLFRIATTRCLNARRSASRRPAKQWNIPRVEPPEPTRLGEVVWLEPYPDALLEGAAGAPAGPEARYEQTEAISLAFVTALQVLPPRQVAVLILRDVLGFHASEVAGMLDSTVESVNSAPQAGPRQPAAPMAPSRRPRAASRRRLTRRGRDRGEVRQRVGVRRYGRAGRAADRRCLHLDAADALRIRGPRRRGPLLRQPVRRGPQVRPGADAGQRPAGVRGLPARPGRHPSRDRPVRPHPHRRPDLRHDPLRQQCAPMVRAAPIAPKPIAGVPGRARGSGAAWCTPPPPPARG